MAPFVDENICRLDVPVHDSLGMRRVQRLGDLRCYRQQQSQIKRLPRNAVPQCRPVDELHRNEGAAVRLSYFIDRADVRVIQRRGRLRFALKPGKRLGISGHLVRQKFQRYKPAEFRVLGFINDAHATAAEFLHNAVVGDGLADTG